MMMFLSLYPRRYPAMHYQFLGPKQTKDAKYDHIAIALKTGKDVALKRTPIQLLTFLYKLRNVVLIGEAPGVSVGDIPMLDVYSGLYTSTKYKRDDELKPDESSLGWKADAHKNIPVLDINGGFC